MFHLEFQRHSLLLLKIWRTNDWLIGNLQLIALLLTNYNYIINLSLVCYYFCHLRRKITFLDSFNKPINRKAGLEFVCQRHQFLASICGKTLHSCEMKRSVKDNIEYWEKKKISLEWRSNNSYFNEFSRQEQWMDNNKLETMATYLLHTTAVLKWEAVMVIVMVVREWI